MACTIQPDKVHFATLRGAALHIISVYESYGVWHRPYQCSGRDGCGEFHLTSTMPDGRTPVAESHIDALFAAVL